MPVIAAMMVLGAGCHAILPMGTWSGDAAGKPAQATDAGRPGTEAGDPSGTDAAMADAARLDAPRSPDTQMNPDASACVFDEFTSSIGSISPGRGNWVWDGTTMARHSTSDVLGAHALIQGSTPHSANFDARTVVAVQEVYPDEYWHGAGLTLLVRAGGTNRPFRQVMCITWVKAHEDSAELGLASFDGKSKWADNMPGARVAFPVPTKGEQAEHRLSVRSNGGTWSATCSVTVGTTTKTTRTVTADISSVVDAEPLGVVLLSTWVAADFDWVTVCPVP